VHAHTKCWMQRLCAVLMTLGIAAADARAQTFPYDQEMLLEVTPLPGSRRVPMLEIHPNGKASVDLWCHSASADVSVSDKEIKFTFTSAREENCTPERLALDQTMAKALMEMTHWRRENDIVVLVGPTTFRFRISTH
jgi:META domain